MTDPISHQITPTDMADVLPHGLYPSERKNGRLTLLAAEIDRLRQDCAEAYQAVAFLAGALDYWNMKADDPRFGPLTKLLDNLLAAADGDARPHADLLPFGWRA